MRYTRNKIENRYEYNTQEIAEALNISTLEVVKAEKSALKKLSKLLRHTQRRYNPI